VSDGSGAQAHWDGYFGVCVVVTGVALAALLGAERAGSRRLVAVFKPLASLGFLAAAWATGALATRYGAWVFGGLVLCFLGDVLLIPASPRAFLAGLGSFLAGHLAFAAAFLVRGIALVPAFATLLLLLSIALLVWRWLAPHVETKMRVPVAAYMVAISAMVALAVATTFLKPNLALLLGTLAFYLSDLSVARDRFVREAFVNRAWGLPLYYAAVLLIAASTAESRSAAGVRSQRLHTDKTCFMSVMPLSALATPS
jgi:uncharacterized membrane protein YhhN